MSEALFPRFAVMDIQAGAEPVGEVEEEVAVAVGGIAVLVGVAVGDPAELVADSSLAHSTLDWKPKYIELEPLIETAWRWHQRHPRGYEAAE